MKYVNIEKFISELILEKYEYITSSVRNNVWRDLPLIKLTVARFVGTMGFLIRYPPLVHQKNIKCSIAIIFNKTLLNGIVFPLQARLWPRGWVEV
jgi:hypothetical protein